jgi:hypothetical protein
MLSTNASPGYWNNKFSLVGQSSVGTGVLGEAETVTVMAGSRVRGRSKGGLLRGVTYLLIS